MRATQQPLSTWSPLRESLFRALWLATLVSNIGTWVQEVGTVWLMTSLAPTPIMISLAQMAMNLPYFLLALPSGALADVMDRRRLLLFSQLWMLGSATALGALTISGITTPIVLLLLTFSIGLGAALNAPAYQAVTPEVVPRNQLRAAIALNSVGINLARAVGPALGGVVVALAGSGAAFLMNALTFMGMMAVLFYWKPVPRASVLPAERFLGAMQAGVRFIRHAPPLRAVLIRTAAFIVCGSAFWAMLPLIVRFEMQRGPGEYGLLLGCFGVGAVLGATCLPTIRSKVSSDRLVIGATVLFAAVLLQLSFLRHVVGIGLVLVCGGAAWLVLLSSFNAGAQAVVPAWIRGRALAVYLLVFFGGMAGSSVMWGVIASWGGVPMALQLAAVGLGVGLFVTRAYSLKVVEHLDLTPSMHWPSPVITDEAPQAQGPVFVMIEYQIDSGTRVDFIHVMREMEDIRRRDGAVQWALLHDSGNPRRYVESFVVESWIEHLRQHERVTNTDREVEQRARAFHVGTVPPVVSHFLAESSV